MSRVALNDPAWREVAGEESVAFARNFQVYVYKRGTSEEVTLHSEETSGVEFDQPLLTDDGGRPRGSEGQVAWVDAGSYDVVIGGQRFPWEAARGDSAGGGGGGGGGVDSELREELEANGTGVIEHGSDPDVARGTDFAMYIWIGDIEPNNMIAPDEWHNTDTAAGEEEGVEGPEGPPGPEGPEGPAGPKGDTGATGAKGEAGATGEKGAKGDTGPEGSKGEKGPAGEKGSTGSTGPEGAKGAKGDTGAEGSKGETGAKGEKGDTGPPGEIGAESVDAAKLKAGAVTGSKVGDLGLGTYFYANGFLGTLESIVPGAKKAYFVPIHIPHKCKLTGISYEVGGVSNGNVLVAIYDNSGNRFAKSTEKAQSTSQFFQRVPFEAQVEVGPGLYWLEICFSSATGQVWAGFNLSPWKEETLGSVSAPEKLVVPTELNNSGKRVPYLGVY